MATRIYDHFRELVNDSESSSYAIPDSLVFLYLDKGIESCSRIASASKLEDITITQADIDNGYVDLEEDPIDFEDEPFGKELRDWYHGSYNRIYFTKPADWSANTELNDIQYRRFYKRFKGVTKEDTDLDHPQEAELGIVLSAIAQYFVGMGIVDADGDMKVATRKSEEGMSVEYGGTNPITQFSTPVAMIKFAESEFRSLPGAQSNVFSVRI